MSSADLLKQFEARAAALLRIRNLLIAGSVIVVCCVAGSAIDSWRAARADGAIAVLERQTAAAQRERHQASLAAIAAKASLLSAKQHADSLEAAAAAAERRVEQLGDRVRVLSAGHLSIRLTPNGGYEVLNVPPIVTAYIDSLKSTIVQKDSALAARDTETVKADTVIVTVDRIVKADSVVVDSQASTITEEKAARPRFGFKSGVVTAAVVALLLHFVR